MLMPGAKKGPLRLEEETQKIVSDSLSKIEAAISEWDSSKDKPADLKGQVRSLRRFHGLLSAWARDSQKGPKDEASATMRLRRFYEICSKIDDAGMS